MPSCVCLSVVVSHLDCCTSPLTNLPVHSRPLPWALHSAGRVVFPIIKSDHHISLFKTLPVSSILALSQSKSSRWPTRIYMIWSPILPLTPALISPPPNTLCFSHMALHVILQTHWKSSCLRAFALVGASARTALPSGVCMAHFLISVHLAPPQRSLPGPTI